MQLALATAPLRRKLSSFLQVSCRNEKVQITVQWPYGGRASPGLRSRYRQVGRTMRPIHAVQQQ